MEFVKLCAMPGRIDLGIETPFLGFVVVGWTVVVGPGVDPITLARKHRHLTIG